jgi:NAD-specific glutamate dehydrogenase
VFEGRVADLERLGAEPALARELITLRFLDQLLEILKIARGAGVDPLDTGRVFYRVADLASVPWLTQATLDSAGDDRWEQRASRALVDDLVRAHHAIVAKAMLAGESAEDAARAADRLLDPGRRETRRYRRLLEEIRGEDRMTLSGLSVAVREMTALAARLTR